MIGYYNLEDDWSASMRIRRINFKTPQSYYATLITLRLGIQQDIQNNGSCISNRLPIYVDDGLEVKVMQIKN